MLSLYFRTVQPFLNVNLHSLRTEAIPQAARANSMATPLSSSDKICRGSKLRLRFIIGNPFLQSVNSSFERL